MVVDPILNEINEWSGMTLIGEAALRKRMSSVDWHDPFFPCPLA